MYKSKSSAFIDLEETIQEAQKEEEKVDAPRDYEFSQQISPMFGVLKKSSDANKVIPPKPQKDEKMVSKPEDSHLDIVTSPFFGYGQNYEIRQMPDETAKEEGFTYDQDDPYVQGLYEHPGIPYDENEEPVDEITLFDDIEDQ